jgi:hypothetical protein
MMNGDLNKLEAKLERIYDLRAAWEEIVTQQHDAEYHYRMAIRACLVDLRKALED